MPAEPSIIAELERLAMWAWPPAETTHLEGWLLRAGDGHTNRANSVQTLSFNADSALEPAIGDAEHWYDQRGLRTCFKICEHHLPVELDTVLAKSGQINAEFLNTDPKWRN